MALSNAYITVDDLVEHLSSMSEPVGSEVGLVERVINAVSRKIDQHCRRRFYVDSSATARVFAAESWDLVYVDDISTTTGLVVKTDTSDNGTFDTTWSSTEYELSPVNAVSSSGETWPYTAIRAVDDRWFPYANRRSSVEVTATWGWPAVPEPVAEACLLMSARVYRRRQSPEGVIGFGDFGPIRVSRIDPDVAVLLEPYAKVGVLR